MNQIDMIDIQRRAIQIVDIKRQPRRIKNNYREETMSAVMTVVAMGLRKGTAKEHQRDSKGTAKGQHRDSKGTQTRKKEGKNERIYRY